MRKRRGIVSIGKEEENVVPYINLQITKGANREQKAQIVKEFTDTLVKVLGKKPEHTHIVIQEIELEDWGFGGLLTDDYLRLNQKECNEIYPDSM